MNPETLHQGSELEARKPKTANANTHDSLHGENMRSLFNKTWQSPILNFGHFANQEAGPDAAYLPLHGTFRS